VTSRRSTRSRSEGGGAHPPARLAAGLRKALHGNATAFGYSVTITASFGAVQLQCGQPDFTDLILFGAGAVFAFGGLEGMLSRGFRAPLEAGADQVITLATALALVSIAVAIATAHVIAGVLSGAAAWFGGAFGASLVFAVIEGLEFMFAEWIQERRGAPNDDE
jgi:hypothetical protein